MHPRREDGVALIIAMMAMLLMMALGAALVMTTTSETLIADNFRSSVEALYSADAVLERAMDDLRATADWNTLLDGSTKSAFVDGLPLSTVRTLHDGSTVKLDEALNMANCQKATTCSSADLSAVTSGRPWGANNPQWQPYAYGRLEDLLPSTGTINSPFYVMLLLGDDPSENDGDPARDGASEANPGSGVLAVRAEAFGPRGARKLIEATVARSGPAGVRLMSWREVR